MGTFVLPSLSSTLTSLTLSDVPITPSQVDHLFSSLQDNLHLTSLSLIRPTLTANEWPNTKVLDSLRRNGILHKVDLAKTPLQEDAAIAAQLRKNAENAARVELLKSQGLMEPVQPSTVRLYLCGLPFSGKTTLCRSMAKCSKGLVSRRWRLPRPKFWTSLLDRTRGIEVTLVESQLEQVKISMWDMAGQLQYHSFHDSMLPDLNDRAAPPLFLYVWNPYKIRTDGKLARDARGRKTLKDPDQFKDDFKYWLRFIASKTPKFELFKPKVIIVMTRADLGLPDMRQWLHNAFTTVQTQFKEYICFDNEGFFQVDARDPNEVSTLASHLFKCTKTILSQVPDDFKVCVRAREVFRAFLHNKDIPPLITKERFNIFCQKHLGLESQEKCEVVALSLRSTGDLIYFPSLELVVVDTQWFCQKIMGDLIYFKNEILQSKQQGFFPLQHLQRFCENELMNSKSVRKWHVSWTRWATKDEEAIEISGYAVVKLLMGLRLACPKDYSQENSDIFIPSTICRNVRRRILPIKYFNLDGSKHLKLDGSCTYIGRRWAVKDSNCTFLTPGIFPLIQVTFHNLSTREIHVDLDQDVMAFAFEGVRAFVEFCRLEGQDNFIDVLVVSLHTLDKALEWLHDNVTVEMKNVFADSRGIPGVELVQSVIQPMCVQGLMEAGERKAVPIQVLQHILMRHVQKNGIKFTEDGIGSVIYTWQTESLMDDLVVSLLGETEVAKLMESYKASLSEAASHVLLNPSTSVASDEESSKVERQRPEFGNSQSHKQREAIYDKICDVEVITKGGFKRLADQLEGVAHQVEDLRCSVLPKLHEMFTFQLDEGEAGKLPRMYVVTRDDGSIVHRVVSKMVPGLHTSHLELLCECRQQPCHRVDGQHGLSIASLEDGLLKRNLSYIDGFLRVAQVIAKVGAHLAVGYGDIIPDFTRVLAGIVDAQALGPLPTLSDLTKCSNSSLRWDFQKGQQWLFDVLSHHNCTKGDQIYKQFGLRRIRYADTRVVAWVCDRHYLRGVPFPA